MSCLVCEVCGWSDGGHSVCGFTAMEIGLELSDVRPILEGVRHTTTGETNDLV